LRSANRIVLGGQVWWVDFDPSRGGKPPKPSITPCDPAIEPMNEEDRPDVARIGGYAQLFQGQEAVLGRLDDFDQLQYGVSPLGINSPELPAVLL